MQEEIDKMINECELLIYKDGKLLMMVFIRFTLNTLLWILKYIKQSNK